MKVVIYGIVLCIFAGIGVCLWFHLLDNKAVIVVFIIGASIFITWGRDWDYKERLRALKHLQERPSLTTAEFGRQYFPPEQADIATQVRAIFAKHLSLDVSQVHPDDKLVEDLRMDALDSMSTVEFVIELEKHFNVDIPDAAAQEMRTLRDVTSFVTGEMESKHGA